jgi:hypothetical protein
MNKNKFFVLILIVLFSIGNTVLASEVTGNLSATFTTPTNPPTTTNTGTGSGNNNTQVVGGGGGGGGSVSPLTSSPSTLSISAQKVDTNKDNKVDVLDFVTLMANWGKAGTSLTADFNSDGKVDILDFVLLMANWTK